MAFGSQFQRVESATLVAEGEHSVTLGIPKIVNRQGWNILECPITYNDDEGEEPKTFSLVEPNNPNDKKAWNDFNRMATRIFDCFNLKESFADIDFPQWKGKTGTVEVGKDKKGFLKVKKFLPSEEAETRNAQRKKAQEIY